MYTKVTTSLVELSAREVRKTKQQASASYLALQGACVRISACVFISVCACMLWVFVHPFSSRTPRSKPQPTLPPHASLFLFLSLSLFLHLSTPSLIKNCRPWLLIKSHLKSLKVSLRLIQFAFLNREHCLKGLINWLKMPLSAMCCCCL